MKKLIVPVTLLSTMVLLSACAIKTTEEIKTEPKTENVVKADTSKAIEVKDDDVTIEVESGITGKVVAIHEKTVQFKVEDAFDPSLKGKILSYENDKGKDLEKGDTITISLVDGTEVKGNQIVGEFSYKDADEIKDEEVSMKIKILEKDKNMVVFETVEKVADVFPEQYQIMSTFPKDDKDDLDKLEVGKEYEVEMKLHAPMTKSLPPQISWEYFDLKN